MNIHLFLDVVLEHALGWPLIIFIVGAGTFVSIALRFVQFRHFIAGWKAVLTPAVQEGGQLSPLQAFLNALSTSLGNGSIAGVATAIHLGGPGAAIWIIVFGFIGMGLRFAEVYLGNHFPAESKNALGGPMIYLSKLPGGTVWGYTFAFLCLLYGLFSGNAMQCNSICVGLTSIVPVIPAWAVAGGMLVFLAYVMRGGSQRIIRVSDTLVPIKVLVFFSCTLIVLGYHYAALLPALKMMLASACNGHAVVGGAVGIGIKQAVRYGVARTLNATEAGLGVAGVLFGATGSRRPMHNGLMSMIGTFISAHLVCFMVALSLVASGVWNNGLTSTALTISAFETVLGSFAGIAVVFLAVSFGMGVIIAYAFVGKQCWGYLTGGRCMFVYDILYCLLAIWGTVAAVKIVWDVIELITVIMLILNVVGIVYLLPVLRNGLRDYAARQAERGA